MMFLSGTGALVFEVVWFSQIGLIVGNSVWSAALVVGAFMAGLALGNGLAVWLARRWANLVRGYATVEAVAALSGGAVVLLFPYLPALFQPLLAPLLGEAVALNSVRLAIAFALMVVPATALGTSLPLLSKPLEQASGNYAFALGSLYGMNTLGAVAGTLLAEFALIPLLGLRGSGMVAMACNLTAVVIALRASRLPAFAGAPAEPAPRAAMPPAAWRVVAAAFLAGGALLALEVVWFRFLLLFQTGTTLMFAVMLAVVLSGIALGGIAASAWSRAGWQPAAAARLAAAAAVIALVAGYAGFPAAYRFLLPRLPYDSVSLVLALSAFLMAPVCLFSGALFTALGDQLRHTGMDAPTATGVVTLANTLGAMAGSLLAAFALLPALGMEASFFGLACAYAALLMAVPGAGRSALWRFAPAAAAVAALAAFPFGYMKGIYYASAENRFGGRLLQAREGMVQTTFYLVNEFQGEPEHYTLATNSYSMSGTASHNTRYMRLFAYLPAAFHPRIESALVICFGVGVTASAVADLPDVKRIDIVDVSRDILEMSDIVYPEPRRHPLRDPRASIHLEDGRFFLQQTARRYDLITGEPPPPKIAGVASLYTREYFQLLHDRLNPGGLATYWLPTSEMRAADALAIIRAFCDVFDDCSLWYGFGTEWVLMGSRGGIAPVSERQFSRLWSAQRARDQLRLIAVETPEQLLAQFMADAAVLKRLAAPALPLVDDYPRRLSPERRASRSEGLFAWLAQAGESRARFEASRWLAGIVPQAMLARSSALFEERGMLEDALSPFMRRADYSYWDDMASLLRRPDRFAWKAWLLDSNPRKLEIAAGKDPADPLVAEQQAIGALAAGRRTAAVTREQFAALTPKGQVATVLRHCVAGERGRARSLIAWIPRERRGEAPYRDFLAWAGRAC